MGARLGSAAFRIHGLSQAINDVAVERVLNVTASVRHSENTFVIGFVFSEQKFGFVLAVEVVVAQTPVRRTDGAKVRLTRGLQGRLWNIGGPRPGVSEPKRRQDVYRSGFAAAVMDRDLD